MDFRIVHGINLLVTAHPLLVSAAQVLATWVVPVVAAAAVTPWIVSGRGLDVRKRATTAALLAAGLALLINQVVSHAWARPRPYTTHASIRPLAGISSDPSFPSDHAAAAFAIAVAALLIHRRSGWMLLALAVVTAASRLLVGAHYPTDILAGAVAGAVAAVLVVRAEHVWSPAARLVARLTDPVRVRIARVRGVRRLIEDRRLRSRAALVIGVALGTRFAFAMRADLLDEMPLALLALWAAIVAGAASIAGGRLRRRVSADRMRDPA